MAAQNGRWCRYRRLTIHVLTIVAVGQEMPEGRVKACGNLRHCRSGQYVGDRRLRQQHAAPSRGDSRLRAVVRPSKLMQSTVQTVRLQRTGPPRAGVRSARRFRVSRRSRWCSSKKPGPRAPRSGPGAAELPVADVPVALRGRRGTAGVERHHRAGAGNSGRLILAGAASLVCNAFGSGPDVRTARPWRRVVYLSLNRQQVSVSAGKLSSNNEPAEARTIRRCSTRDAAIAAKR